MKLLSYPMTLLLAFLFLSTACKKEDFHQEDLLEIEQYLADNNLTAQSLPSGLHYIIEEAGTGGHPTVEDEVTVHYTGYFSSGEIFDGTSTSPITFPLSNVIEGWQQGIPLLQKGGKGMLFIPSKLGYGSNPPPGIPKNAMLIFDVELVDF